MSKITQDAGIDKIEKPEDQMRFISQFFDNVKQVVNNGINLSDNFDGAIVRVTFTAASTNTAVSHGLGRVVTGYIPVSRSANMTIYDGTTAATQNVFYLQSSAAGTASILVF